MVSKKEYDASVAHSVRDVLRLRPSIISCLKMGIVNYSALARELSKEIDVDSIDAIVSAVKRYRHELEPTGYDKQLGKMVANSTIEMRTDVAAVTLPKGVDWRSLESRLDIHHVMVGPAAALLVVDERSLPQGDGGVLAGRDVRRGLAAITIKCSPSFSSMPGSLIHLISPLSRNGINVDEVLSCYNDKILLLKLEDARQAFSLLTELINVSREKAKAKQI